MNSTFRSLLFWIVIFGVVVLLWQAIQGNVGDKQELPFNEFLAAIENGEVASLTKNGQEITGKFKNSQTPANKPDFKTIILESDEVHDDLSKRARAGELEMKVEKEEKSPLLMIFFTWLPILLIVGLWIFFMRQFQAGGNKALSFGKSKAKLLNTGGKKVTFDDVAGVEEAKAELAEVVEFLREPQKFQKLGAKIPKGVLLMGSPGTGKTLLARAIAGEANVPFFSISGSDFVEMFVGVGASPGSAISSNRARRTPPASFSSTRSTPSGATAVPASAAATTSASRRSTNCWSRWTASRPTRVSS